jgi:hypothetical protein
MDCEHVFEIAKCDGVLEDIHDSLADLNLSVALLKERKQENRKLLYLSQAEILSEQEMIIQKAINALEELKVKFAKDTDEKLQVAVSEIDKGIESVKIIEQRTVKNTEILEAAEKYGGSTCHKVIEHLLADDILKQREMVKDIDKQDEYRLLFVKNEDSIQMSSLGTLSLVCDKKSENKPECFELGIEKTSDELVECDNILLAMNTDKKGEGHSLPTTSENYATTEIREINVEDCNDKSYCSIYGISVLLDGSLVIIDFENTNMKLLSSDYTLLDVLRLPGRPIRICCIGDNEVAVSFERVKRINRYSIAGNTISYDGGFPTSLFNHGIAYDSTSNSIVAIMGDEDFSSEINAKDDTIQIEFRNPFNGKFNDVIRDFMVEGNKTWSLALRNTQAIQITDDRKIIIAEKNRVLSFNLRIESDKITAIEENFYVCRGEILKHDIENIAIDDESIFACTKSGCVLQISASDFTNNRVLISNTDSKFLAIAVDEKSGRIILGSKDEDIIRVYEFRKKL